MVKRFVRDDARRHVYDIAFGDSLRFGVIVERFAGVEHHPGAVTHEEEGADDDEDDGELDGGADDHQSNTDSQGVGDDASARDGLIRLERRILRPQDQSTSKDVFGGGEAHCHDVHNRKEHRQANEAQEDRFDCLCRRARRLPPK